MDQLSKVLTNQIQSVHARLKRRTLPGMQAQLNQSQQEAKKLSRQADSIKNELEQHKQAAAAKAAAAAEQLAKAKVTPPGQLSHFCIKPELTIRC